MDPVIHESAIGWDPARPEVLVICCVDGRWFAHFREFVRQYLGAGDRTDMMAVPGGAEPLTLLDLLPKDFNFFRRRIEALVQAHGTRRIVAIGHQDCAWYASRKIGRFTLDLTALQKADLRRAAARLRDMLDGVTVEAYFARLKEAGSDRVVFERL